MTPAEKEANDALKDALRSIQRARELCERAEYGGLLLASLVSGHRDIQCAHDMALDRI